MCGAIKRSILGKSEQERNVIAPAMCLMMFRADNSDQL